MHGVFLLYIIANIRYSADQKQEADGVLKHAKSPLGLMRPVFLACALL